MAENSPRYALKVLVISCIGAVLCNGLPSMKPTKHADSPSLFEYVGKPPSRGQDAVTTEGDVHPPKHILKTMKKLTVNQDLLRGRGNTVRSFLPRQGKYPNQDDNTSFL